MLFQSQTFSVHRCILQVKLLKMQEIGSSTRTSWLFISVRHHLYNRFGVTRENWNKLFIRFLEQQLVRGRFCLTTRNDLESSEICLKTVREKATNWCYSVALKPLQVRQILYDPKADDESSPGSIWRISGTCQIAHGTKPAASSGVRNGRENREISTTARSKIRSVCSKMPLPSAVCCWVI